VEVHAPSAGSREAPVPTEPLLRRFMASEVLPDRRQAGSLSYNALRSVEACPKVMPQVRRNALPARHEVPGTAYRENRPGEYGLRRRAYRSDDWSDQVSNTRLEIPLGCLIFRVERCAVFVKEGYSLQSSNQCAYRRESDRTLRDGPLRGRCSRHFVPGYDQTSLRDWEQSPVVAARNCLNIPSLHGIQPRAKFLMAHRVEFGVFLSFP
jgi:hypothetical protein